MPGRQPERSEWSTEIKLSMHGFIHINALLHQLQLPLIKFMHCTRRINPSHQRFHRCEDIDLVSPPRLWIGPGGTLLRSNCSTNRSRNSGGANGILLIGGRLDWVGCEHSAVQTLSTNRTSVDEKILIPVEDSLDLRKV